MGEVWWRSIGQRMRWDGGMRPDNLWPDEEAGRNKFVELCFCILMRSRANAWLDRTKRVSGA